MFGGILKLKLPFIIIIPHVELQNSALLGIEQATSDQRDCCFYWAVDVGTLDWMFLHSECSLHPFKWWSSLKFTEQFQALFFARLTMPPPCEKGLMKYTADGIVTNFILSQLYSDVSDFQLEKWFSQTTFLTGSELIYRTTFFFIIQSKWKPFDKHYVNNVNAVLHYKHYKNVNLCHITNIT